MNQNPHIRTDTSPAREAHLRVLAAQGDTQAVHAIVGVGMLGVIIVLVTLVMNHEPSATTFSAVAMCREACNGRMQAFNPHNGLCECQPEPMRCVP